MEKELNELNELNEFEEMIRQLGSEKTEVEMPQKEIFKKIISEREIVLKEELKKLDKIKVKNLLGQEALDKINKFLEHTES